MKVKSYFLFFDDHLDSLDIFGNVDNLIFFFTRLKILRGTDVGCILVGYVHAYL